MHVYYADAGLRGHSGHHADQCRALTDELKARGVATTVLGYAEIEPAIRSALGAEPFFRSYLYWQYDRNPERDWRGAFDAAAQQTREDLARLHRIGADDVIYLPASTSTQLMGAALWLADLPAGRAPRVVMEFGMDPGVDVEPTEAGGVKLTLRDPRIEASATLCRLTAPQLRKLDRTRLRIGYACANGAAVYAKLLEYPVEVPPIWHEASGRARSRVGKRPIVAGVLGHQRNPDKGYHLVPELVRALLQSHSALRFRVHNSAPDDMPEAHAAMRALAAADHRIELVEHAVDRAGWSALLASIDLILCPYSPRRYQLLPSGIQAEAIANAIPTVVPAGSDLARLSDAFGGTSTSFLRNDVASVLDASRRLLDRYDEYAAVAFAAADRWRRQHGPANVIDRLLAGAAT